MIEENRDWVSKELVPKLVAESKLKSSENVIYKYFDCCEIQEISLSEAFMLTNCFRVKVFAFRDEEKSDRKEFNIFVKVTPKVDAAMFEMMGFDRLFHNEELCYTKVLSVMGLAINTPRFCAAYKTADGRSLVIDDFANNGWRLSQSRFNLSLEHILLAVDLLGKFHGNAYAVKHDTPDVLFEIIRDLKEARYHQEQTDPVYNRVMCIGTERVTRVSRGLVPDDFMTELENVMADPYNASKRLAQPKEPMAVLCHGDYLRNNIAFRFENDLPVAALMFDFQTLRYSSPMIDLCVFMANSTGKDVRLKHFDKIMLTYHSALVKAYNQKIKTQVELPEHLSYENILKEYAVYLPYGIIIASHFLGELHSPSLRLDFDMMDPEKMFAEVAVSGGKVVDEEIASLVLDCYNLCSKLGLKLST